MKNAYSLLSARSFIHFPASRGAFSSPERAPSPLRLPNWTEGGWEVEGGTNGVL